MRGSRAGCWLAVAGAWLGMTLVSSDAAFDMFMKIDGVDGESSEPGREKWIEVSSFSHGVSQPAGGAASSGGARSAGRCDHADFSVVKELDAATPKLNLYCCNGTHIPKVEIEFCQAAGDKKTFYKVTLKDVIVAAVEPQGEKEGTATRPEETVRFNYGSISWEYILFGEPTDTIIRTGWNVMTGTQL